MKDKVTKFFNNPAPLIITLILIICVLLLFISKSNKNNKIYIGKLESDKVSIANIHAFINNDMNYFYADSATYLGDEEVYTYEIGYYVENTNGELIVLKSRNGTLDKKESLSTIVSELSAWSFAEAASEKYIFNKDIINNFSKLHFVIKASMEKNTNNYDINIDELVELNKITK